MISRRQRFSRWGHKGVWWRIFAARSAAVCILLQGIAFRPSLFQRKDADLYLGNSWSNGWHYFVLATVPRIE